MNLPSKLQEIRDRVGKTTLQTALEEFKADGDKCCRECGSLAREKTRLTAFEHGFNKSQKAFRTDIELLLQIAEVQAEALDKVVDDDSNGYSVVDLLLKTKEIIVKYGGYQNGYAIGKVLNAITDAKTTNSAIAKLLGGG